MNTITAQIIPAQGQSSDDVLALVLNTQHERALINAASACPIGDGSIVLAVVKYDQGAGEAEYADCAARIANMTGVQGVDSVRVS